VIVSRRTGHEQFVMRTGPDLDGQAPEAATSADARMESLVDGHLDSVWRLLRRQGLSPPDADDATQQVFMIASQKLDRIAPGRERSFLYGVALRVASNMRRSRRRRPEELHDELDARASALAAPEERTELARAWALLDELLAKLPEEQARVLALAEIEELEVPEIAALEEIPVGTAASRLRRARAAFRELLRHAEHRNPFARAAK
jgi:RNA polymerase sigma-70 factor (ECF subfamily)